jgi:integrase
VWSFTADTEEKSSAPTGLRLLGLSRAEIEKVKEEAQEQDHGIFRPDGVVGDIPYRALPNGEVEALIQGGKVRFRNLDLGFKAHPHMLRHACGYALANKGHDTRALQAYLGHRNIQHTVRYTELSRTRFKDFWRK